MLLEIIYLENKGNILSSKKHIAFSFHPRPTSGFTFQKVYLKRTLWSIVITSLRDMQIVFLQNFMERKRNFFFEKSSAREKANKG